MPKETTYTRYSDQCNPRFLSHIKYIQATKRSIDLWADFSLLTISTKQRDSYMSRCTDWSKIIINSADLVHFLHGSLPHWKQCIQLNVGLRLSQTRVHLFLELLLVAATCEDSFFDCWLSFFLFFISFGIPSASPETGTLLFCSPASNALTM